MRNLGSKIAGNNKVVFSVWAPLAASVAVVGDFNHWKPDQSYLINSGEGYWEGIINDIKENDIYKFLIKRRSGDTSYRIDPAARDTVDSETDMELRCAGW